MDADPPVECCWSTGSEIGDQQPLQPGRIVARQITPNLGGPTEESAKNMIRDQLLLITEEESLQLFTTYIYMI